MNIILWRSFGLMTIVWTVTSFATESLAEDGRSAEDTVDRPSHLFKDVGLSPYCLPRDVSTQSTGSPWWYLEVIPSLHNDLPIVDLQRTSNSRSKGSIPETSFICAPSDIACSQDPIGFNAILQLHGQIDDDNSGDLDREESQEFIRDDLKYESLSKEADLHGNDDLLSVQDLWKLWITCEVYKWTTEQVVDWLTVYVELPQYSSIFRSTGITGRLLPRLASNSQQFSSSIGIKNPVHRQKLTIKAIDLVLFGPPKIEHHYGKDIVLIISLLIAICGGYYAYSEQKLSQAHLAKVLSDLGTLQKAEDNLRDLQEKLDMARIDQAKVDQDKRDLEQKLRAEIDNAKAEAQRQKVSREESAEHVSSLKHAEDELNQVRTALREAEKLLEARQITSISDLQQWLQLSYEVETKYFDQKREATDKQLKFAKEMCEKLGNQKSKFLSAFRMAHTLTIDDTDQTILSVKVALDDIKINLQERTQRWRRIEQLCGFSIVLNPGASYLNSALRDSSSSGFISSDGGHLNSRGHRSSYRGDVDDMVEDDVQSLFSVQ